jgi:ribosomal protein S18 acetylase RimI-like enzyme
MPLNGSVEVRVLVISDLHAVTQVHFDAFPDSALTKLGFEAVRRYYEWQMLGPHCTVSIGAFSQNELIGFCFGGVFRGALSGFIQKNRIFLIARVLTHPWLLLNPLFRTRLKVGTQSLLRIFKFSTKPLVVPTSVVTPAEEKAAFGILSIAVSPKAQGSGTAVKLMQYSEDIAIERGFTEMSLTVHPTNFRAIGFYEKMDWEKIFSSGKWEGHMRKFLNN